METLPFSLREYNPSLRLGRQLGEGYTSVVFAIQGSGDVLKVMDTRCVAPADTDDREDISARKYMHDDFIREVGTLRLLKDSRYVISAKDDYEYIFPEERQKTPEERCYRSQFLLRMPRMMPLDQYLPAHPSEQVLIQMAMDICSAFCDCAKVDIIHRDVKPANIFVDTSGRGGDARFVLGDFGFCRRVDYMNNIPVSHVGTPGFTAPEIEEHRGLDGRLNVDIYSLGVTLFYLVSHGSFPPDYIRRDGSLRPLRRISPAFADIILNAVQPNPGCRYQTAREMLFDLSALTGDSSRRVVDNYAFLEAKQAIMRGNFRGAEEIARHAYEKEGRKDCLRLLAYCIYHEKRHNPAEVQRAKEMLDYLAGEGDAVARYIRAEIHGMDEEYAEYAASLRDSAEAGCIVAQSRYGRFLYTGQVAYIPREPQEGLRFLCKAAEEGYLPALRFLKRERDANPAVRIPDCSVLDEFIASGNCEGSNYRQLVRDDIIPFL